MYHRYNLIHGRSHILHKCLNKFPLSGGSAEAYAVCAPAMWHVLSDSAESRERAPPVTPSACFLPLSSAHQGESRWPRKARWPLPRYEPAAESLTVSGMPIVTADIELERIEGRARRRTPGPTPKRSRKRPL